MQTKCATMKDSRLTPWRTHLISNKPPGIQHAQRIGSRNSVKNSPIAWISSPSIRPMKKLESVASVWSSVSKETCKGFNHSLRIRFCKARRAKNRLIARVYMADCINDRAQHRILRTYSDIRKEDGDRTRRQSNRGY